jgi:hypothetical protein
MVSADECFLFDIQGYLHLHGALRQDEVSELLRLVEENMGKDITTINEEPSHAAHQLNRPLSRMIDADVRFARLLDHPAAAPYLAEFLGTDYRHIDNDLYFTYPGYAGGQWHRGVAAHPSERTRITLIVNFGRADAGPWPGYTPRSETLASVSERQRAILTAGSLVWHEPVLV